MSNGLRYIKSHFVSQNEKKQQMNKESIMPDEKRTATVTIKSTIHISNETERHT